MQITHDAEGVLLSYPESIVPLRITKKFDALIYHTARQLGRTAVIIGRRVPCSGELMEMLNIPLHSVSAVRNGKAPMPEAWVLKFVVYGGIPYETVCAIMQIKPHWHVVHSGKLDTRLAAYNEIDAASKLNIPLDSLGFRVKNIIREVENEEAGRKGDEG